MQLGRGRRTLVAAGVVGVVTVPALLTGVLPGTADAVEQPGGTWVAQKPAAGTPYVMDGRVLSIAEVGDLIVLGGSFTGARNDGSGVVLARDGLLGFDRADGRLSTGFAPDVDGAVTTVLPAGDGMSVYVAGSFTTVDGVARSRVARLRVSDGAVLPDFDPGTVNGRVEDLRLVDGRLWIAGAFTHVQGSPRPALATLDPDTGALDPFWSSTVSGTHAGGTTTVRKLDASADGSRVVALGNFTEVGGQPREQLVVLDTAGASAEVADFSTTFYEGACAAVFPSYVRDLAISPDGSYFVVSTSGTYRGPASPCDTTARWEMNAGSDATASWIDSTGGDTTYAVEVGDGVVYTGGHARWQNNPFVADTAGPGAVSRPGIAALDPDNGLPLSWNPTRARGVGVFDFLLTDDGLWVASDTDRIGGATRGRIALLPTPGASYAGVATASLPATVYRARPAGLTRASLDGDGVGAFSNAPAGGRDWGRVTGAFVLGDVLYTAWSGGRFTRQTFDGTAYGPAVPVNTADLLSPLQGWRDDVRNLTSLFYDRGRLYFTRQGVPALFYRYFTPQSDVVGAVRHTAVSRFRGFGLDRVRGGFLAGDAVYWADDQGRLVRQDWATGTAAGSPVAGTAAVVSGPEIDGVRWGSRALFARSETP